MHEEINKCIDRHENNEEVVVVYNENDMLVSTCYSLEDLLRSKIGKYGSNRAMIIINGEGIYQLLDDNLILLSKDWSLNTGKFVVSKNRRIRRFLNGWYYPLVSKKAEEVLYAGPLTIRGRDKNMNVKELKTMYFQLSKLGRIDKFTVGVALLHEYYHLNKEYIDVAKLIQFVDTIFVEKDRSAIDVSLYEISKKLNHKIIGYLPSFFLQEPPMIAVIRTLIAFAISSVSHHPMIAVNYLKTNKIKVITDQTLINNVLRATLADKPDPFDILLEPCSTFGDTFISDIALNIR